MSHLADSRVDGVFPLQHQAYDGKGYDTQLRASIFGARVTDRLTGPGQLGHWVIDPESVGDIHGGQLWKQLPGGRDVPMWRFAMPVVVVGGLGTGKSGGRSGGGYGPGTTTAENGGGGGFNGTPPQIGEGTPGVGQPGGPRGELRIGIGGGAGIGPPGGGGKPVGTGSGFAQFSGVKTNFSNGSPQAGATFTSPPNQKDTNQAVFGFKPVGGPGSGRPR